jgi:DNA polymerase zeta
LLFREQDLSKVKAYLYKQWTKILSGRISVQDFIFCKEVRMGTYRWVACKVLILLVFVFSRIHSRHSAFLSIMFRIGSDRGPLPPAALVCAKRMAKDRRAAPQYGERVPYIVVHGQPESRLIDMVVAPSELVENRY